MDQEMLAAAGRPEALEAVEAVLGDQIRMRMVQVHQVKGTMVEMEQFSISVLMPLAVAAVVVAVRVPMLLLQ